MESKVDSQPYFRAVDRSVLIALFEERQLLGKNEIYQNGLVKASFVFLKIAYYVCKRIRHINVTKRKLRIMPVIT